MFILQLYDRAPLNRAALGATGYTRDTRHPPGGRIEERSKSVIQDVRLADFCMPDRDFFACAEADISDTTSVLTMVGGKVVYEGRTSSRSTERRPQASAKEGSIFWRDCCMLLAVRWSPHLRVGCVETTPSRSEMAERPPAMRQLGGS